MARRGVYNKLGICNTVLMVSLGADRHNEYNPVQSSGSVNLLIILV